MTSTPIPWKQIGDDLVLFAPLRCGVAILFGAISAGCSVLRPDFYSAQQPIGVRDEATFSYARLGRFASQTELKTVQETILEMTQNSDVVSAALQQISPPEAQEGDEWPSTGTIDGTASEK